MMPSIVSPVKQNVPVKCLPLRPTADANDAWTKARRWPWVMGRPGGNGAARIKRSNESIVIFDVSFQWSQLALKELIQMSWDMDTFFIGKHLLIYRLFSTFNIIDNLFSHEFRFLFIFKCFFFFYYFVLKKITEISVSFTAIDINECYILTNSHYSEHEFSKIQYYWRNIVYFSFSRQYYKIKLRKKKKTEKEKSILKLLPILQIYKIFANNKIIQYGNEWIEQVRTQKKKEIYWGKPKIPMKRRKFTTILLAARIALFFSAVFAVRVIFCFICYSKLFLVLIHFFKLV